MEKTTFHSTYTELVELRERAQRAIDATIVLIGDYRSCGLGGACGRPMTGAQ